VTREQALSHPELISGKRGLFGFGASKVAAEGASKVGEDVAVKTSRTWGQRLKSFAVNMLIGGVAAIAGTDIYQSMNHHSKALGDPPAPSPDTSATTFSATTSPVSSTTPYYTTTSGTTVAPSSRAFAERAGKEPTLDHELPEDIFSESSIPSHI